MSEWAFGGVTVVEQDYLSQYVELLDAPAETGNPLAVVSGQRFDIAGHTAYATRTGYYSGARLSDDLLVLVACEMVP